MSTYLQLCKDVRAQAGISGDGPANVTGQSGIYADVVRWVDESYNDIQTKYENWNFLYTTMSFELQDTFNTYDMGSSNIRQIVKDSFKSQFQFDDKIRMSYIPYAKFRVDRRFDTASSGVPKYVTELPDGTLQFYPTPDDTYTIFLEGYSTPDVLSGSTDTPIFPSQYHELIKLNALIRYSEYYNVPEMYQSATRSFEMGIKKMEFSELPRDNLVTPSFVPFA